VSVYGGQVVHALRQACLERGIHVVAKVVAEAESTRGPDQHTVLS
jgi:hypothetical protein